MFEEQADLQVDVSDDGVIMVAGELDVETAPILEEALMETERPGSTLVVDLSGLQFVDSSGLDLLVRQHKRSSAGGGRLELRNVSAKVARVIQVARLAELFGI